MIRIDHIKAYILGLIIGGGRINGDIFFIELPFKKWGMDPSRMNVIASDILTKICTCFNTTYNFNVTYEIGTNKWLIKPLPGSDISELKADLARLKLPTSGFLLKNVDLTYARENLKGVSIESFLSGIFDARASLTLSHRRFTDSAPVVSIEIPGSTHNFRFVVQLCSWLTDLGSITDQILYNHPNQHSASDPEYRGWKKGFKIRFLVRSFLTKHSFALQSKSIDLTNIEQRQDKTEQTPCLLRKLRKPSPVTIHTDQNSIELPEEVRNKVFLHYLHFCSVLGCPHAPLAEVNKIVRQKEKLVNFFPRLSKGNSKELLEKLESIRSHYFPQMSITQKTVEVNNLINISLLKDYQGLEQGLAYLFSPKLNGKRHMGDMAKIIRENLDYDLEMVSIGEGFNGPVLLINNENDRAFISSSVSNILNQELIRNKLVGKGLSINIITQ